MSQESTTTADVENPASKRPARKRRGLLLINLGTPDDPQPESVRRYLKEFLLDPWVIDIAAPLRWLLVNGIILRKRPAASAAAYQKIWTERGSPLLFHSVDLREKVANILGEDWDVRLAMRYGSPSIASVVKELNGHALSELVVLPLYPQYSQAATESCLKLSLKHLSVELPETPIHVIRDFFDYPLFIEAFAKVAEAILSQREFDHYLFSFHGLPERQVRRTDTTGSHCLKSDSCCERIGEANRLCYRAQCFATMRSLAGRLGLSSEQYSISFQSRLGRTPWIQPFTDVVFGELIQKGKKRVAVFCPSFVADCLETLEEIQIRGREDFKRMGGEELELIPSLNSSEPWVNAVAQLAQGVIKPN